MFPMFRRNMLLPSSGWKWLNPTPSIVSYVNHKPSAFITFILKTEAVWSSEKSENFSYHTETLLSHFMKKKRETYIWIVVQTWHLLLRVFVTLSQVCVINSVRYDKYPKSSVLKRPLRVLTTIPELFSMVIWYELVSGDNGYKIAQSKHTWIFFVVLNLIFQ
jgi:hypothetical protein